MRLFFIVDETFVMLPQWLDEVINNLSREYKIVGITPTGHKKGQSTIFTYLISNASKIGGKGLIKLGIYFSYCLIKFIGFTAKLTKEPATIAQVAKKHKVKVINTSDVNSANYLKLVRKTRPDIIISSGSQIFKRELLNLPAIGCINRHSALLPSYGGLFPIFRSLLNNEKFTGVTIHYMVEKIDKGKIIYQEAIKVGRNKSLFELYLESYDLSIKALLNALNIVRNKKRAVVVKGIKPSYYSFPTDSDWKKFFRKGLKFI